MRNSPPSLAHASPDVADNITTEANTVTAIAATPINADGHIGKKRNDPVDYNDDDEVAHVRNDNEDELSTTKATPKSIKTMATSQ